MLRKEQKVLQKSTYLSALLQYLDLRYEFQVLLSASVQQVSLSAMCENGVKPPLPHTVKGTVSP